MAIMKDVAKLAGVSVATVSCALSGKKQVSHEARVKIMAAIEMLNYVPNESARKLRLHISRDIGVLLTSIDDIYHTEIFKGITSVIQNNNYSVNIIFSNNQPKVEIETLNEFTSRNYTGIILMSCMPNEEVFFEKLLARNIPVVFIERHPPKLEVNFVGISNKNTISFLTERAKVQGYKNIALFCGSPIISSESDCVNAFKEFNIKNDNPPDYNINYTNMSKEDAFRVALAVLNNNPRPQVIIATSENIAHGILESEKVLGIPLHQILILTFSEETWLDTKCLPQTLHTSRPAFKLGASAAGLLMRNIDNPELQKKETIILDDNIIRAGIDIPKYKPTMPKQKARKKPEINLLILDPDLGEAVKILTEKFKTDYGVIVNITQKSQDNLPKEIMKDVDSKKARYDAFMFDIPWHDYFAQNNYLDDITDFITGDNLLFNAVIKDNLTNSIYKNRYYSIPFTGGAQLLFYRIDLFEDPLVCKNYFSMHNTKLQPPRTWTEFNTVARFFTRQFNPASPVEFGTTFPGINVEQFCPEIYNRIWGFNGSIFNDKNVPQCNSRNNIKAFENFLDAQQYTSRSLFQTDIVDTVQDFYNGKTAMLVTFTIRATEMMNAINYNVFGKLGFTYVPHRTPISVGWNLGINPFSGKKELVLQFFKWLYRKDVTYYLTILDGQSTSVYPYENNELLKLYPWMKITMDNFKYTRKRIACNSEYSAVIPWNEIETVIYSNSRRMFAHIPVSECLGDMNNEILALIRFYAETKTSRVLSRSGKWKP
jgi:multiple sugar transport system substrate-binding protein